MEEDGTFHYGDWGKTTDKLHRIKRVGSNHPSRSVRALRDELTGYFSSEHGMVPCQYDRILEGAVPQGFIDNYTL